MTPRRELIQCRTCGSRTLPQVAARTWRDGLCPLCVDPDEREIVRAILRRPVPPAEQASTMRRAG